MDIDMDDDVLRDLALGKGMDYSQWPALYPRLMSRLEQIVYNEFPIPKGPSATAKKLATPPLDSSAVGESSTQSSTQSTDKENAEPTPKPAADADVLPKQLQNVYKSITSTLFILFTQYPPHTVQRLAELLLRPKEHYRTLPSYLHALDRVVHVTSGAHTFPLPPAVPEPSSSNVLSNGTPGIDPLSVSWGNSVAKPAPSLLGSDESLGGALLTPITWLSKPSTGTHSPLEGEVKTESTTMTDGPNGPGGVETVTVSVNGILSTTASPPTSEQDISATLRAEGGVTQGELLRQEQRAGVVPAGQLHHRGDTDGMGEEDELPHARGPEEIGMEDMGPQNTGSGSERKGLGGGMQGIDIEAAVGRKVDASTQVDEDEQDVKMESASEQGEATPGTPKREADGDLGGEEKRVKAVDGKEDKDTEMVLVDADGREADEPKFGEKGETKGPDAVDTSSI